MAETRFSSVGPSPMPRSSESAEQSARGMDSECRGHVDDIRGDLIHNSRMVRPHDEGAIMSSERHEKRIRQLAYY